MKHSRGILLSGPPGTGKTLIARTICEVLRVKPQIVNGSEICNHLLGESEAKIRHLFHEAEFDAEKYSANSDLHIIIFDEIDALCKTRSTTGGGIRHTVEENATTHLLTKIDGLNQLNNFLIIGTTNTKDSIDPALIRPGRLENVIKIGLPDSDHRLKIYNIDTKLMLQNGILDDDIDIARIIRGTNGLTGAHVEQVVRLATNNAIRRDVLVRGTLDIDESLAEELHAKNIDFINALRILPTLPSDFYKQQQKD
ncbi:unnamed protein product [Didymodactylos carnosus]|uniref:Vesicle-fusing ATPase n=1 Tax=Didymodactylos carnosus TaxID=1234261 RepID=A0A816CHB4_9BILA|nr:unnamed protein product [Didymodactylos carnosus]CAF4515199.1 unnamed protein product [Didymodactylos carnosus]